MPKCNSCSNQKKCTSELKNTLYHNCSIFSFDDSHVRWIIDNLTKENNQLARQVFNIQSHYDLLKQSYDNVFDFIAEKNKTNRFIELTNFMEWVPTFKREGENEIQ